MDGDVDKVLTDDDTLLFLTLSGDLTIIEANDLFIELLPFPEHEVSGISFLEALPEDHREIVERQLKSLSGREPVVRYEHEMLRLDGTGFWVTWQAVYSNAGSGREVITLVGRVEESRTFLEKILVIQRDLALALTEEEHAAVDLTPLLINQLVRVPAISMAAVYSHNASQQQLDLLHQEGIPGNIAAELREFSALSSLYRITSRLKPHYFSLKGSVSKGFKLLEKSGVRGGILLPVIIENDLKYMILLFSNRIALFSDSLRNGIESMVHQATPLFSRQLQLRRKSQFQNDLREMFNRMDDLIFLVGMDGVIQRVNKSVQSCFNLDPDRLEGRKMIDFYPTRLNKDASKILAEMLAGRESRCSLPLMLPDGSELPVETVATPGEWDGQRVLIAVSRDISQRLKLMDRVETSEDKLELAIRSGNLGMWEWDFTTGMITFHSSWKDIPGVPDGTQWVEPEGFWRELIHPEDIEHVEHQFRDHLDGNRSVFACEYRVRKSNDSWRWVIDTGRVLKRDPQGLPLSAVGVQTDVTDLKKGQEKLRVLSITDYLTCVYNKRHLFDRLDQAVSRAMRLKQPLTVAMFDLDDFKEVNDSLGHLAGDFALKEFASMMVHTLRPYDLVGRFGGDEFMVIFDESSVKKAMVAIERIRSQLESRFFVYGGSEFKLHFSCGLSSIKEVKAESCGEVRDQLIKLADNRLYKAKEIPGNSIVSR